MNHTTSVPRDGDLPPVAPSDARIIADVRAGESVDVPLLWRRHAGPARRAALAIAPAADAEELVQEAFTMVLRATRAGGGPRDAFRP